MILSTKLLSIIPVVGMCSVYVVTVILNLNLGMLVTNKCFSLPLFIFVSVIILVKSQIKLNICSSLGNLQRFNGNINSTVKITSLLYNQTIVKKATFWHKVSYAKSR